LERWYVNSMTGSGMKYRLDLELADSGIYWTFTQSNQGELVCLSCM